jgi:hypothetical protein
MVKSMRLIWLALILFANAITGCIENPGASRPPSPSPDAPRVTWTEMDLSWRNGTSLDWRGETYAAEEDDEWVTDGWTYLYARQAGEGASASACREEDPPQQNLTYVFVRKYDDARCHWAEHPSVACSTASFCARMIRPYGPPP